MSKFILFLVLFGICFSVGATLASINPVYACVFVVLLIGSAA